MHGPRGEREKTGDKLHFLYMCLKALQDKRCFDMKNSDVISTTSTMLTTSIPGSALLLPL